MKLFSAAELGPSHYREMAAALREGGLVCFPAGSSYRLAADLFSEEAVARLMQAKRRVAYHPALVYLPDGRSLDEVAARVPPLARRLAAALWPGPLTLLVEPGEALPRAVAKTLVRATGRIGVSCPAHPVAAALVKQFGGPLVISSANFERKAGANSLAKVRKSFEQRIDVCVDAGDLAAQPPSTLVEVTEDGWRIEREGAIGRDAIERAAGAA